MQPKNIRDHIEEGFGRLGHLIFSHRWLVIAASLLLAALLIANLPRVRVDTSAEGLLHKRDPAMLAYRDFREQFGRDQMALVGITPAEVFNLAFLNKLKRFHRDLEAEVPYLAEVRSLVNVTSIRGHGDEVRIDEMARHWPTDGESLGGFKQQVLTTEIYRNAVISADGGMVTVVVRPLVYAPADAGYLAGFADAAAPQRLLNEEEIGRFVQAVQQVCRRYQSEDFPLHLSGDIVVEEELKRITMETMGSFTLLTSLIIMVLLGVLFRRVSGVVLPLIIVNIALFATLGLMGLCGAPITLNTSVLPSLLLAVGIGDSVHLLAIFYLQMRQGASCEEAIAGSLGHSGLALVMTSLTTAGGLLSFVTSGIAPVADLGIYAAVGVMLALLFTVTLLPALLAVLVRRGGGGRPTAGPHGGFDRVLGWIADLASGHPRTVIAGFALLLAVSLGLALQLRFSHNSLEYLDRNMVVRQATELLDEKLAGSIAFEILVDTGHVGGLYEPEVMARLAGVEQLISGYSIQGRRLGRPTSVVDNLRLLNQELNGGDPAFYTVPESRDLIAQELLLLEGSGVDDLERLVDGSFGKARITLRVPWVDAVAYTRMLDSLERQLGELFAGRATVTITGLAAILCRTFTAIIESMANSYLAATLVITALMVLLIGNLRLGLISMIPNLLPIVVGLGFMKLAGIPLDYSTIMVGGIAIGLAVDDTVHFMHNFRRYYQQSGDGRLAVRLTLQTAGRAMLFTTLILGGGFFVLLLAPLKSTISFGLISGFTIVVALLADFLLAPALLVLLAGRRRDITGR